MSANAAALTLIVLALAGCSRRSTPPAEVASAPELMIRYGCPTCHVIPHVPGAVGKVGPSLLDLNQRSYLGGALQNTPQNLQAWIMHPQHFHPGTAMPEMGVTSHDADVLTRFLETRTTSSTP